MALIIFHAGMSKTGSTSIQEWLAGHLALLRSRGIQSMRIEQSRPTDPVALVPSTPANATSKFLTAARDPATRPEVARRICEELDAHAAHADVLVVSSESYEVFFNDAANAEGDVTSVFGHLEALARAHSVRVAYYVRPQHSWLESAWLQWGFRDFRPPDVWLRRQRSKLEYLQISDRVRQAAPDLSFEMRPFRVDLLDGGHVVSDFARVFLGLGDLPLGSTPERWSNRSIPLEMAIVLRDAPPGMFWSNMHDNKVFYPLKKLILQWDLPQTEIVARSRQVLQRYAHATFESDNQRLVRELGWNTEYFVPPAEHSEDAADTGLAELNVLWKSAASDAERQALLRALRQLLSTTMSPPDSAKRANRAERADVTEGSDSRPRSRGRLPSFRRPRS
ncbi:MAG: hypothetical protein QOH28_90 [Actinomycetota bacterium]|jgi:hypothetical protein|nr:hypothetical protein [Actinomycetota bacterium]